MSNEKDAPKPAPKAPEPAPKKEGGAVDLRTEQEKGGKDPVGKAEPSPGPVETIEDLDIGPRDPYPTGNPPKPKEG